MADDNVVDITEDQKNGPWNEKNTFIFIELCNEEVKKQQKVTTTFTKTGWTSIRTQLIERTGYPYQQDQLKNKYNLLRKEYKLFKQLIGETGVSWDSITNKVFAEESQWKMLAKVYVST